MVGVGLAGSQDCCRRVCDFIALGDKQGLLAEQVADLTGLDRVSICAVDSGLAACRSPSFERKVRRHRAFGRAAVGSLGLGYGVLGYIDAANGRFILNTQRHIEEDANISEAVLSRLSATMDSAGYIYRRIERIRLDEVDDSGLHLVRTRVGLRRLPGY